jgi:hypothetical protein
VTGYTVECPAYTAGPFASEATAERRRADIERLGACNYEHTIKEQT